MKTKITDDNVHVSVGKLSSNTKYRGRLMLMTLASRCLEILVTTILLMASLIPMMVIAVSIKATSPGPVFFRQRRVGKNEVIFTILKFRTMRVTAPSDVPTHRLTTANQHVTTVGKWLRRTSLDELPQLINILKGDMTFIGPRPALYNQEELISLRREADLTYLKPGLTGWAQVNGRDKISLREKVNLERQYFDSRTIVTDILILVRSVLGILMPRDVAF